MNNHQHWTTGHSTTTEHECSGDDDNDDSKLNDVSIKHHRQV